MKTISSRDGKWRANFWVFLFSVILFSTASANATETFQDIRVQDANATQPQLIFACDRQTSELESLFTPH